MDPNLNIVELELELEPETSDSSTSSEGSKSEVEPEHEHEPTPEEIEAARDWAAAQYLGMPKIAVPLEGAPLELMRDPESGDVRVQLGPVVLTFLFTLDKEGAASLGQALAPSPVAIAKLSDLERLTGDGIRRKRARGHGR